MNEYFAFDDVVTKNTFTFTNPLLIKNSFEFFYKIFYRTVTPYQNPELPFHLCMMIPVETEYQVLLIRAEQIFVMIAGQYNSSKF